MTNTATAESTTTVQFREHGAGPGGYGFTVAITHLDPACAEAQRLAFRGAKLVEGLGLPCQTCTIKTATVPGTAICITVTAGTNTVMVDGATYSVLKKLGGRTVQTFVTLEDARAEANRLHKALAR